MNRVRASERACVRASEQTRECENGRNAIVRADLKIEEWTRESELRRSVSTGRLLLCYTSLINSAPDHSVIDKPWDRLDKVT